MRGCLTGNLSVPSAKRPLLCTPHGYAAIAEPPTLPSPRTRNHPLGSKRARTRTASKLPTPSLVSNAASTSFLLHLSFYSSPDEIAYLRGYPPTPLEPSGTRPRPPAENAQRASALTSPFLRVAYDKLGLPMEGHDIGTMRYIDLPEDVLFELSAIHLDIVMRTPQQTPAAPRNTHRRLPCRPTGIGAPTCRTTASSATTPLALASQKPELHAAAMAR